MELFKFLMFVFFIVTSFMIILLVLFQDEQGDGIGGVFGGGSSSIFGAKSSNVAIKITGFFIALFFIFVVTLSFINTKRVDDSLLKDIKTNEKSSPFWNDDTKEEKETDREETLKKKS
ncbi:preprotein translocase subunit SecG [Borrelia turcica IST7]|uniref:Protein-export membrane protein SecG n=1 Tax=Borrelia turcica IST7 TaxID=1104446 RepID=A0A386PMK3_9SPIR|nr:preprotein translocase subunit SecG [Borrelia turcica]AYE35950.1 preprotein translocase subunit SecG [Borrelia turcica IST7]